jgi:hypothetical protein
MQDRHTPAPAVIVHELPKTSGPMSLYVAMHMSVMPKDKKLELKIGVVRDTARAGLKGRAGSKILAHLVSTSVFTARCRCRTLESHFRSSSQA